MPSCALALNSKSPPPKDLEYFLPISLPNSSKSSRRCNKSCRIPTGNS